MVVVGSAVVGSIGFKIGPRLCTLCESQKKKHSEIELLRNIFCQKKHITFANYFNFYVSSNSFLGKSFCIGNQFSILMSTLWQTSVGLNIIEVKNGITDIHILCR